MRRHAQVNGSGSAWPAPKNRDPGHRRQRLRQIALAALASAALLGPAASAGAAQSASVTAAWADWSGGWDQQDGGFGGPSSAQAPTPVSTPATAAQSRGVVLIDTVLPYEGGQGAGTGMVLTSSGQILTNYHVVEGASTITVTLAQTGMTYPATVVGSDQTDDVALLQIKGATNLRTVTTDHTSAIAGEAVTAIGNAGGTGNLTAAPGTISSLRASVTTAAEGQVESETLSSMIETSADVVAGDSGGPLLNDKGEVVGIDTAASTGSAINGYTIPITRALSIVHQIESGTETSTVQIGPAAFLGVELSTDSAAYQNSASGLTVGAPVGAVVEDSAAGRVGLQAGGVITGVADRTIASPDDLTAALRQYHPGDHVRLTWLDQWGDQHSEQTTLGASPVA